MQAAAAGYAAAGAHGLVQPVPGRNLRGDRPSLPWLPGGETVRRKGSEMTLEEMAVRYRGEAEALGMRIKLVMAQPADTEAEELLKRDRLRLLEAMRRDVRDVGNICAHYYDRSYRRSERYMI